MRVKRFEMVTMLAFALAFFLGCSDDSNAGGDADTGGGDASGDVTGDVGSGDPNTDTGDTTIDTVDMTIDGCVAANADGDCRLGYWRYVPDGQCCPADPCRDETICADAHRICLNELGTPVCGRCLDGWEGDADEDCTEAPLDTNVGRFRVGSDFFWIWSGTRYERLYVAGVNVAGAIPGTGPNGRAITYDQYTSWLTLMSDGGLNVIRVYSPHPPALYEAVDDHNEANPDTPIYMFQGVWLRELESGTDLTAQTEAFDESVEKTVRMLHGDYADDGYTTDVSEWLLGWLVGREVYAEEVMRTDENHPEMTSYEGTTMRLTSGTPTEVWVTERLDRLVTFEQTEYGGSRPVAFSSWMELDPLSHPTEPTSTGKDLTQIDLSGVDTFGSPAGHFISYHVYPYYPKFISEDPWYRAHVDEIGPNAYRGVLLRLREHYRDLPVLVAEYGIPSSWGRGHPSYSGMHHGGHSEDEQGQALARMTRDIHETRYAGGLAFQWQDGWWKPTWITNRITFPRDRYAIWHDLTTPSESYGLLAFEPPPFEWESVLDDGAAAGPIADVHMAADAKAFYLKIDLVNPIASPQLVIGFDTYRDDLGDSQLPDGTETSVRSEIALELDGTSAQLTVIEEYDLYAPYLGPLDKYHSVARDGGNWVPTMWQMTMDHESADGTLFVEGEDYELGALRVRMTGETATSMDAVSVGEQAIEITLPWVMLQVADPSTRTVVHNDAATDEMDGEVSEGVRVAISLDGTLVETRRFAWETWDQAPETSERLKEAATMYFEAVNSL